VEHHGLFTRALLQGLRGEAQSKSGDVDVHSLQSYITRNVDPDFQTVSFFGDIQGRFVLIHKNPEGKDAKDGKGATKPKKADTAPPPPSARLLATLKSRAGQNILQDVSTIIRNSPELRESSFRWLEGTDTGKEMITDLKHDGILVRTFPFIIHRNRTDTSCEHAVIPYGAALPEYSYSPRGGSLEPFFEVSAIAPRTLELRDSQSKDFIQISIEAED
jgi:hypothetical protein